MSRDRGRVLHSARPYIDASIDELEEALERFNRASDAQGIAAVAHELTFRRTSRAQELARSLDSTRKRALAPPRASGRRSGFGPTADSPRPAHRHKPTSEQQQAIDLFSTGRSLKINAYAGTGKTSTLELLSHSTHRRGQYIAFNRAIVKEAQGRFPKSVNCSTTHGLAYRATPAGYRDQVDKMTGRTSANQLVQLLGLQGALRPDREHSLQPRSQAYLILETIRRFTQSEETELRPEHVPRHGSLLTASDETLKAVAEFALRGANHVWSRMLDPSDPIPLGHDGYLKLWALGQPRIPADFILLDEAQDTNAVVLGVLRSQIAQLVYVGDRYQQIYEWRGAINAMERMDTDAESRLTQSFRFGAEIADAASRVLQLLNEATPLTGSPYRSSSIGVVSDPRAILARTNATCMQELIDVLNTGKQPHIVGGTGELMEMLRGVDDLKNGVASSVSDFFGFENWQQVVEFSETTEGEHLLTFVRLVETHGERRLMWALNRAVDEAQADIVISTAHRAKGREWDTVRLTDDFLKVRPKKGEDAGPEHDYDAELRLFYVALTRARDRIEVPPTFTELGSSITPTRKEPTSSTTEKVALPARPGSVDLRTENHEVPHVSLKASPSPPKTEKRRGFLSRLFGR